MGMRAIRAIERMEGRVLVMLGVDVRMRMNTTTKRTRTGLAVKKSKYEATDEKLTMPDPDKVDTSRRKKRLAVPMKNHERGVKWFEV